MLNQAFLSCYIFCGFTFFCRVYFFCVLNTITPELTTSNRHGMRFGPGAYLSEYLIIEYDHKQRRQIEREHGGIQKKGCVVEGALVWIAVLRLVHARQHGQRYQNAQDPNERDGQVDAVGALVLGILDRVLDRYVAVDGDGDQVEDGGRGSHHVCGHLS